MRWPSRPPANWRVAGSQKDKALEAIADALTAHTQEILAANGEDLDAARANGMSQCPAWTGWPSMKSVSREWPRGCARWRPSLTR